MSSDPFPFGYHFEPPAPPDHPGHRRLTVVLRPHPTERHYDPELAEWPIVTLLGELDRLAVFHPWPMSGEYRAAPGRVVLTDRKRKVVEAFTFGGTLQLEASAGLVVARLESPAPILPLLPPHDVAELLADEVEILIARRRAHWDEARQPYALDEHLARVDPLSLFQACLVELQRLFAATPAIFHDTQRRLAHYLRQELAALEQAGHRPHHLPPLEKLL
jgi:hypothetical protein